MEVQNIPQQTALYQVSGSVGIGLTNPGAKLEVGGFGLGKQFIENFGQAVGTVKCYQFDTAGGAFNQSAFSVSGQNNTTYADPTSGGLVSQSVALTNSVGTSRTNPRTLTISTAILSATGKGVLAFWYDDLITENNVLAIDVDYDDTFRLAVNGQTCFSDDTTNTQRFYLVPCNRYVSFQFLTGNIITGNSTVSIKYWKMFSV